MLRLQDAIAAAVVRELQLTVAPGLLSSRSTLKNTEAYDLYLRGRHAPIGGIRMGLRKLSCYLSRHSIATRHSSRRRQRLLGLMSFKGNLALRHPL